MLAELLEEAERQAEAAAGAARGDRDVQLARDLSDQRFLRPNLDSNRRRPEESDRDARERAGRYTIAMGGAADVSLLYAAVKLSGAERVIETGVAFGWSSLAVLAALVDREEARLVSVDMPHPKLSNDTFVGIVVPPRLRGSWELIREPDRRGLEKAISRLGGPLDLCHYDSDKEWWGRQYAYPLLWSALAPGGIFISDDVQDNLAFAQFVEERTAPYAVIQSGTKYVGIARKEHA